MSLNRIYTSSKHVVLHSNAHKGQGVRRQWFDGRCIPDIPYGDVRRVFILASGRQGGG